MRVEVIMPQMGESIVEGTVVEWLKQVGDEVKRDEDIFVLSTDKVDAEVPSPVEGILAEILVQPGDTVEVGSVCAYVETDRDADISAGGTAEADAAETADQEEDAPEEAPADKSAARRDSGGDSTRAAAAPKAAAGTDIGEKPDPEASPDELKRVRSTPLVRKIAAEHGIGDLSVIEGTGSAGRVTKKDIQAFIDSGGHKKAAPAAAARPAVTSLGDGELPAGYEVALAKQPRVHVYDNDRIEPMTRMRASIVENMLQARRTTAHCHTVWEADVTNVMKARKQLRAEFDSRGARLTFTPFFVAAVVAGLRAYPLMNAAIRDDEIVYRGNVNVGVASAVEEGLIVPVVKRADQLNLFGLAKAVNDIAYRSKNRKLKPEDVADGTFTISNAGVFGSLFGIPILVQPQVGILGIGGIKKRVTADENDNIRVRSIVTMCLTFDHRLIDGETADGFMKVVTEELSSATMAG